MNTIICPSCGKEVEISQALRHQIEDQILADINEKHKKELEIVKQQAEAIALKKATTTLELQLKNAENEARDTKKQNQELKQELLNLSKQLRELQEKDDKREIEMEKRILQERQKLHDELSKSIYEKAELEKMELKKQLEDTKRALEEAQRKANQTSQQLQGEVMELNLEEILKESFPDDIITPVGKGISGADIRQIVKTKRGSVCGEILIESKRTKVWSDEWISKLKTDIRAQKASVGIIITSVLPKGIKSDFGYIDGIYVSSFKSFLPFLELIRQKLIEVAYQKFVFENKDEKADFLYEYVTGYEFRQQIESLAEIYQEQIDQITKERAAFERIWKVRESQAKRILLSTTNIYGSMQGILGGSLPTLKSLDMFELDSTTDQMRLLDSENDKKSTTNV